MALMVTVSLAKVVWRCG